MKLLELLRTLPSRTVAMVMASHLMLLAGILWGGMPYLVLQGLLAVELFAINLATIPLYRERGMRKHVLDMLKTIAGLAILLFFVVVTYGVTQSEGGGSDGYALPVALATLKEVDTTALAWALGYVVVHLSIALWLALSSPNPRLAWMKSTVSEGATTLVAMLAMIFVSIFVATQMAAGLSRLGLAVDVEMLLACLMVALRAALALVMASMSERQMAAMAADPYQN